MLFRIFCGTLLLSLRLFFAVSAQGNGSYVILISVDGFRYDYAELHGASYLKEVASAGATTSYMIPSFPSKTFPNHYTLVTGLYPDHHGIVSNTFYDPQTRLTYKSSQSESVQNGTWYGGSPLWVVSEKQGLKAASFFWIGSEAPIQGIRPTYYKIYDESVPEMKRAEQVVEWLKLPVAERPRFITLYFELIDDAGHDFGPESPGTREAVRRVDEIIRYLGDEVSKLDLPVNFILVSDHGMIKVDQQDPIDLSRVVQKEGITVTSSDTFVSLHSENKDFIEQVYYNLETLAVDFDIYKRPEIPDSLHFNNNPRIGDLILIAHAPKVFGLTGSAIKPGAHGYNPYSTPEMGATFIAWGPDIKSGITVPPFENIHVFPFIAMLLNLDISSLAIDGQAEVLKSILKEKK